MTTHKFEQWAIIELFGHTRIAGLITEQVIGGCSFIRVDVPELEGRQSFTKLYGQAAIYAMTFVDEDTAKGAAWMIQHKPVNVWSARRMLEGISSQQMIEEDPDEDEDEDFDPDEPAF